MANALANPAYKAPYPYHEELNVFAHSLISEKAVLFVEAQTSNLWITLLAAYFKDWALPRDKKTAIITKVRAARYALINDTFDRRSFSGPY